MKRAQSTIEFTFVCIAIAFLAYGLVKVFRWGGMDLADRRWTHEKSLVNGTDAEQQLSPDFYRPKRINAFYRNAAK